jgi:hypothetical protein
MEPYKFFRNMVKIHGFASQKAVIFLVTVISSQVSENSP